MATDRFNRLIFNINRLTEVEIVPTEDGESYYWEWHGDKSESFDTEELALIDWIQQVCQKQENETTQSQKTARHSDKELLVQLERLVDAAANEADKWKNEEWREATEKEYDNYRRWCYERASKPFWEIANQIKIEPDEYYRDGDDEHDMRAYLRAHEHTAWVEAAINGDALDKD